jgi:hypothetical protein
MSNLSLLAPALEEARVRLRVVVTQTTSATLAAADSGKVISNSGATANITYTLPPAVAGRLYEIHNATDAYTLTVTPDGTDRIGLAAAGVSTVLPARTIVVLECHSSSRWTITTDTRISMVYNVRDYGATGDGVTNDAPAIQAAINALPMRGGIVYFPYGIYRILSTLNVVDKSWVSFIGQSINADVNDSALKHGPTAIIMDSTQTPGWTSNTPMFLITTSVDATGPSRWGGFLFQNLTIRPYSGNFNASYSGHAVVFKKKVRPAPYPTGADDFAGHITFRDCTIKGAHCGILFDDSASTTPTIAASANGTGWGWVTIDNCNIQANKYGVYSNNTINVLNVRGGKIWQNTQATNGASDFVTRTGGGIILNGGNGVLIQGTDLEGQQVGVHATNVRNLTLDTTYFEANYDAAVVLVDCTNVTLRNCSTNNTAAARIVYAYNCERLTMERGRQNATSGDLNALYFVLGPFNRDVITDTPELTQFSMSASHSKTPDGYGFVIQTMTTYAKQQPVIPLGRLATSTFVNGTPTFAGTTYQGHGESGRRKAVQITGVGSGNGGFTTYFANEHLLSKGEWVVTTVVLRAHPDNNLNNQLYMRVEEAEAPSSPNPVVVMDAAIPSNRIRTGEWVAVQWCHKKTTDTTSAQYENNVRIGVPIVGQKLLFDGIAKTISSHPFVRPTGLEIFNPTDKSNHYLFDGVSYHGSAVPTWSAWSWDVGDVIYSTAPTPGGNVGWVCTTAGAPGTWKAFGDISP